LGKRSEEVVTAVVGEDAGRRQRAWKLLQARLRDKEADLRIQVASAQLGAALGAPDAQFAAEANGILLKAMRQTTDPFALSRLSEAFATLAAKLDAAEARECAQTALEQMGKTTNGDALSRLSAAVATLAAQLDAAGAREVAPKVLEQRGQTANANALSRLSAAVGALAARMKRPEVAALLTAHPLPAPAAKQLLPELEKLAGRKFASLDDAAKWFREN
jgi:hypothetical protein